MTKNKTFNTKIEDKEKCVIVTLLKGDKDSLPRKKEEMRRLCETANLEVVEFFPQNLKEINPRYVMGDGKAEEISMYVKQNNIDVVLVDFKLTGSQTKNLSDIFSVKVIDRIMLILDIFAQNATSNEGKIEVKLAQNKYLLTRLSSLTGTAGRCGGAGVGMRGPGETKLELDKRKLQDEIALLEKEIKKIKNSRIQNREKRLKSDEKLVVILGYTNAGKSTLLNVLAKDNIYAFDKLFATLDTTSRKLYLSDGKYCIITDTVGFISDLPHELIESFASSLDEIKLADLILHVIDNNDKFKEENIQVTNQVLDEINATQKRILVFNKCDELKEAVQKENQIYISAKNTVGIKELKEKISQELF